MVICESYDFILLSNTNMASHLVLFRNYRSKKFATYKVYLWEYCQRRSCKAYWSIYPCKNGS